MFDYLYGWLDLHRGKQSLHIKGGDDLPWFQLFTLEMLNEVLYVFEVVWGLAYKGFDDMGKLATPYVLNPPTGHSGSEGCTCFVNFGKAIEFGGVSTSWV